MNDVLVIARLCLALVFLAAGLAKLLDQPGTLQALVEFGVPRRFAAPLHVLLPTAELAAGGALLFTISARWGAASCLALLALFVGVLARALRRGDAPDCRCFGQLHSTPASWATVVRNLVLALPALYVALAGPGPSIASWATGSDSLAHWLAAVASLAALATTSSVVLWRENRRLRLLGNDAPPKHREIGTLAPRFSLPSTSGSTPSLQDLLASKRPCVLAFVSAKCGPCRALIPDLARWREAIADHLNLVLIISGDAADAEKLASEHVPTELLVQQRSTVSDLYGIVATPSAILVAPDGTVGSAPVAGAVAIESLIRLTLRNEMQLASAGRLESTLSVQVSQRVKGVDAMPTAR